VGSRSILDFIAERIILARAGNRTSRNEDVWRSGGIVADILNLDTRWR
jgi:hypothetical protein